MAYLFEKEEKIKQKMGSRTKRGRRRESDKKILERLSDIKIPSFIFRKTSFSILESIVDYLKIDQGLNFHEMGVLLNRDERNIWTIYHRAMSKK